MNVLENYPKNIYPGSFDPFHASHQETHRRAEELLEEDVSLLIVRNYIKKSPILSVEQRADLMKDCFPEEKIHIVQNNQQLLEYFSHAKRIVRGIRLKIDALEVVKLWIKNPQFTTQLMFEFFKKGLNISVEGDNKQVSSRLLKELIEKGEIEKALELASLRTITILQETL